MNILNTNYYNHSKPELAEQTKSRLQELNKLGLTEVGVGEFGVKGIVSGLYIERVWGYSQEEWDSYITWLTSKVQCN